MGLTLAVLLTIPDPPCPDHLERFPPAWEAADQASRCRARLKRLADCRNVRGWEGGHWEAEIAEAERWLDYWETLGMCHEKVGVTIAWRSGQLARLKELIGPAAYLRGWRPPELPASDD